ncbi:MAG TPA: hypothetical protein VF784_16105 [Anaerolineales bacterium]
MRVCTLSVLLLLALSITACASFTARPGELQSFASACDKPNEGLDIAVEGYLRLPDSFSDSSTIELHLYADLSFSGKPIGVMMQFGNGPNQVRLIHSSYRDEDLKVHLADGMVIPFRTKVRVSGRMFFPAIPQDFECGLEHVYVQRAK